jgi:hypothetical protein
MGLLVECSIRAALLATVAKRDESRPDCDAFLSRLHARSLLEDR